MAVQKKKVAKTTVAAEKPVVKEEKPVEAKVEEVKPDQPIIVADAAAEPVEKVEEIEDLTHQDVAAEVSADVPASSPLSDFKEKMEEELSAPENSSRKSYMWPILLIFIIAVLLLAGVFIYKKGGITLGSKVNVVTLTPTPTITPEPTVAVDLSKYEIEILNGGGVDGEASRLKVSLVADGFTISSVGNADNSDFTDTVIQAKSTVNAAFLSKLKSSLETSFTVKQEVLSADSSVPVIVIIGTKK